MSSASVGPASEGWACLVCLCDVSQASISVVVRVYRKPEDSITVARFTSRSNHPIWIAEYSAVSPKSAHRTSSRGLETYTVVNISEKHPLSLYTKVLMLKSLKLLPRVGKTDGQTKKPSLLPIWSSIIWQERNWLQNEMLQQAVLWEFIHQNTCPVNGYSHFSCWWIHTGENGPLPWDELGVVTLPDWKSSVGIGPGMLSRLNSAKLR